MSVIPEIAPVFIVGTGRCGSTMLSNMLREHPDVLSLSEFLVTIADFGGRISHAFPEAPIDANGVWSIIAGCHPKQTMLLRKHCDIDEMIYPLTSESRFGRETGVPAVLLAALPHLTLQHDALFEELHGFVMTLKPAHAMRQYECIFEWLKNRFSRRVWVERSGGSLRAVPILARSFPTARFIHIVRDGRDCAISMSRHHGFRLHAVTQIMSGILGCDPFESSDRSRAWRLPRRLRRRQMQPSFRAISLQPLVRAVSETVQRLLERWEQSRRQGLPEAVVADTQSLTIATMVRRLFSHHIDFEEALHLGDAVRNGFRMIGRRQLCRLTPPLWIPTRSNQALKRDCNVLDSFVRSCVVEHRSMARACSSDILSALIESRDPKTNAPLSVDSLVDEAKTLMVAGFETTSSTLAWALYLLARHPEAAVRWHEEIDRVLCGRCPDSKDLERLSYTAHVLHETMRLYPPVHTVARDCLSDDHLGKFKIPRGSTVLISVYGIQRGEEWGPDPEAFRPERFASNWPKQSFLPFATGKHVCLGNISH